jgi:hypothetical protein
MNPLDERFPAPPAEPDGEGHADVALRYEDVTQDGRIALVALPNGIGEAVWRAVLNRHPARDAMRDTGVIPILTRFVVDGRPGPFAVDPPLDAHGSYLFAHSVDAHAEVDRLYLNMWVELEGRLGRTWDPQPESAGSLVPAGRVFAEHVLTRLFAPPEERKVRQIEGIPGIPPVPPVRYAPRSIGAVTTLPEGAQPLEPAMRIESPAVTFGLVHTDSNQHVNSLVYPQLFEEFALRRFAALGVGVPLLARGLEIAYRKPCFAGDRVHVALQTYALGDRFGAVGVFVNADEAPDDQSLGRARPHAAIWMQFER